MATAVTSKDQVTIEFEVAADGRVMMAKVGGGPPTSRFAHLPGRAGAGLSTDEIMALTRSDV